MKLRIRSIYTKLLLSFFGLIILLVLVLTGWANVVLKSAFFDEEMADVEAQGKLVSLVMREAQTTAPDVPPQENPEVRRVLDEIAAYYGGETWMVDARGEVLYSTKGSPLPSVESETYDLKHLTLHVVETDYVGHASDIYAVVPVQMGRWGDMTVHCRFTDRHDASIHYFMVEQALAVACILFFLFPISRIITTPMRRLQDAVLQYSDGNLKSRFRDKRGDEIGELGKAFNVMADNLENMIQGGRELVANVSHELRSPLARLRISEEMARGVMEREGVEGARRHLDDMLEEVEHLDGLIGRMLEITRLDLKEIEARPEPVDLSALALRVAERFDALRSHSGVRFGVAVTGGIKVRGHVDGLTSILSNLLDNAFKYCPAHGEVRLVLEPGDAGWALLRVENTYPPLPQTEIDAILRPFYRAPGTQESGYGLGLALVSKIVEKHGGHIRAENAGLGFRMDILLPGSPD